MNKKTNNLIINSELPENIFKLEYFNQNLNDNVEYQKWNNLMIKKYGRKAKLFKCQDDDILFYTSNEDCKSHPFYQSVCPYCNNTIYYLMV